MKNISWMLIFLVFGFFSSCTTAPAPPVYDPKAVDYSKHIQEIHPVDINYEIIGVIFVTTTQTGKLDFNSRRIVFTGERMTYEKIMREAITRGANGIINIIIDTVDTKSGDIYTRKQTATGLAIKYISELDRVSGQE